MASRGRKRHMPSQIGALGSARAVASAKPESRARRVLQSLAVGVLVVLALIAAINPQLASQIGAALRAAAKGRVTGVTCGTANLPGSRH